MFDGREFLGAAMLGAGSHHPLRKPPCGLSDLNVARLLHHLFSHIGGKILNAHEKETSREFGNYECRDRGSFSRLLREYFPSLKMR